MNTIQEFKTIIEDTYGIKDLTSYNQYKLAKAQGVPIEELQRLLLHPTNLIHRKATRRLLHQVHISNLSQENQ